jgi:hypothetical protein
MLQRGVVVLALALLSCVLASPSRAEVSAAVSFDFFYSNLTPHGSWVISSQFGRVWQPSVYGPDWNPYYDGHWEYTDLGWTWVSDYEWGAIPYHYGTWVADPRIGWVWVPGYTWAPAWVVFRTGPDYIGWAPVAPSFALGASFSSRAEFSGSFLFVSTRDFCAPRIRTLVVPETRARAIVNQTTIVNNLVVQNNIVVNRGPDVRVVEAAARRPIPVTRVESVPRVAPFSRVRRDELSIAPERRGREVRAAEPVSEARPIPQGKDVAQMNRGPAREGPRVATPTPRVAPVPQGGTVEKQSTKDAKPPNAQAEKKPEPKMQEPKKQEPKKKEPKKTAPKKKNPKQDSKQDGEQKQDGQNEPS